MSLLVLLKNRVTGQPVVADDDDNEFLNIINCLSGSSLDKSIRIRNNDNAFAVARFDQIGTNKILELFKNGSEVANFANDGTIEIIGSTPHLRLNRNVATARILDIGIDSADGVVMSVQSGPIIFTASMATGIVTFNAQPVFPNTLIKHKEIWFKKDPQDNNVSNDQAKVFIAPSGVSMRLTKFSLFRRGGSHTAGQNITWQVVKNGVGIGSGVSFNDTNNAINTEYSEALNTSIVAGDWIGINNTVLGGGASEEDVSMLVEWEEKLAA